MKWQTLISHPDQLQQLQQLAAFAPVAAACNHPFTARHVPRCETQRCPVMSSLGRRRSGELLALQGRLRGVQDQGPVDWLEMGGVTLDLDVPES